MASSLFKLYPYSYHHWRLQSPEDATVCRDQESQRAKLVERYGLGKWWYCLTYCLRATLTKHGHLLAHVCRRELHLLEFSLPSWLVLCDGQEQASGWELRNDQTKKNGE